jgi:hypothetical protein
MNAFPHPTGAAPRFAPKLWSLHASRGRGCGCQQGDLARPARREDELGSPGLLRRFSPASESHRRDPPLVAPSRLARMDPTRRSRSPTSWPVPPCEPRSVGPSPGGGSARSHMGCSRSEEPHGGGRGREWVGLQPDGCVSRGPVAASLPAYLAGLQRAARACLWGGQRSRRRSRPGAQRGGHQRHPVRVMRGSRSRWWSTFPTT